MTKTYAVLHDGQDIGQEHTIIDCFRLIGRRLCKRISEVTVKEAWDAGFEIQLLKELK